MKRKEFLKNAGGVVLTIGAGLAINNTDTLVFAEDEFLRKLEENGWKLSEKRQTAQHNNESEFRYVYTKQGIDLKYTSWRSNSGVLKRFITGEKMEFAFIIDETMPYPPISYFEALKDSLLNSLKT